MNEYNHHRIIERVASKIHLDDAKKQILKDASNFTDFFINPDPFNSSFDFRKKLETAKDKYYFYLFYYDIAIKGNNTIKLKRITENHYGLNIIDNNSIRCMEQSGEKLLDGSYSLEGWDSNSDEKEFFSSINDRKRSPNDLDFNEIKKLFSGRPDGCRENILDTANQSDNVAFLHAMGAMEENKNDSRNEFEKHLKKCFSEYLFLENEEDALFMLGIAFHGIMDSFTPSHMDFQKYSAQDMGLHAQGDVIPILGFDKDGNLLDRNSSEQEIVYFEPGQIKKDPRFVQPIFSFIKHYDNNEFVNPVEYRMLRIFLIIGDIEESNPHPNPNEDKWKDVNKDVLWEELKGKPLSEINQILGNKDKYRFSPQSYAYSEAAIRVISDIYKYLSKKREECKNYSEYKNNKQEIVNDALDIWKKVYDKEARMDKDGNIIHEDGNIAFLFDNQKKSYAMKTLREEHTELSLYYKDPELEDWKAQYDIDRWNRLKG